MHPHTGKSRSGAVETARVEFELDLLGYSAPTMPVTSLGNAFVKAATAQLDQIVWRISSSPPSRKASDAATATALPAVALHFKPPALTTPISAVFAAVVDDASAAAVEQRKALHKATGQ